MKSKYLIFLIIVLSTVTHASTAFVNLPNNLQTTSAYIHCNDSGDYGKSIVELPQTGKHIACALNDEIFKTNTLASPLEGFRLIGVKAGDVEMIGDRAGTDSRIARLSEAVWRNRENTECILATHLEMLDAPLSNGQYFEINDIARAGFSKRKVAVAYYYKPHSSDIGGNTEVLFRAGRTFTSVATSSNQKLLPATFNAPTGSQPFSFNNTASFSENWVDFTTDISFKDSDQTTRAISAIFYVKYDCDLNDPITKPNVIRLRTTGSNPQESFELSIPGLIPVDGEVEMF